MTPAKKSQLQNEYTVAVRYTAGTYVARAHGTTVSCTTGEQQAVERLAVKLWGEGEHSVEAQPAGVWLIKRRSSYGNLVAAAAKMEEIVSGYLHDYEYDDGYGGSHTPKETEQLLIDDAVYGLLGDEDFLAALTDWQLLVRARKQETPHAN